MIKKVIKWNEIKPRDLLPPYNFFIHGIIITDGSRIKACGFNGVEISSCIGDKSLKLSEAKYWIYLKDLIEE